MTTIASPKKAEMAGLNYHNLRQMLFEQSLTFVEINMGRKGSLIDLGAGHCQFSIMAERLGWRATALDARTTRVPDLPANVRFIEGDVDSPRWDPRDYDVIVCLGLYYHLDQEQQHRLLDKCRGRPIILDTHFAIPDAKGSSRYRQLGPTYQKNGEIGADFGEDPALSDEARKEKSLLSSFENRDSWWQTKDSLIATLHQFGWEHIWTFSYPQDAGLQRTFFVCQNVDYSKPFF
jgi:hypothetical protein